MNRGNRKSSIGVIVRDNKGEVLATLLALVARIIDPVTAEATAALRAVTFTWDLGFYKVVFGVMPFKSCMH